MRVRGHFSFVAVVLGLGALAHRWVKQPPAWAWRLAPYGSGCIAAYWTVERVAGFWK